MKLRGIVASTVLVCFAIALVGCSSDSKSSSTTSKDAVCSDQAALKKSIKTLTDSTTLTGGKSDLTNALDQVKSDADALRGSAKSDLKPQVDALQSAIDQLKTAVGKLGNGSLTDAFQAIGTAVTKVSSASQDLIDQVNKGCSNS